MLVDSSSSSRRQGNSNNKDHQKVGQDNNKQGNPSSLNRSTQHKHQHEKIYFTAAAAAGSPGCRWQCTPWQLYSIVLATSTQASHDSDHDDHITSHHRVGGAQGNSSPETRSICSGTSSSGSKHRGQLLPRDGWIESCSVLKAPTTLPSTS